jgi:hypothetical protein
VKGNRHLSRLTASRRLATQSSEPGARSPEPPFSPLLAQAWYEWRAGGKALPLLIAVLGALFSLPFLWVRELAPLMPGSAIMVNLWLKILLPCLFALPLLAAVIGCGRRPGTRERSEWVAEGRRELALPWFVAVRPLGDAAMVAARFAMAARSTAAAWGIALGVVTVWMLLPAQDGPRSGPLLLLLLGDLTPRAVVAALAALGFLVLWTWKNQVQGLWADASGRAVIVHGAPIVAHNAVLATLLWVSERAGPLAPDAPVPTTVWAAAGAALALKLAAATAALRFLGQRGEVAPRGLAALAAGWLLAALALAAALIGVARLAPRPGSLEDLVRLTYLPFLHPAVLPPAYREPLILLLFALLFLPLTRLAAAPIMLGWNRRR